MLPLGQHADAGEEGCVLKNPECRGSQEAMYLCKGMCFLKSVVGIELCSQQVLSSLGKCIASVAKSEMFELKWCLWRFCCGDGRGCSRRTGISEFLKWERSSSEKALP